MSEESFLERRLDASTWPLAVGDVAVLLAFLLVGVLEHWPLDVVVADPTIYLLAAGPFVLGWIVAAPLVGAYSPGAAAAPNSSIPLAIRSWIPAAIIGFGIRVFAIPDRGFDPIFGIVILVGGSIALGVWRFVYFKIR
ncbi:MAG: DUF3054 domain-containing protein [Natronomonas sp.]